MKVARVATVGIGLWFLISGNFFGIALAVFLWYLGSQELRVVEALHGRGWSSGGFDERYRHSASAPRVEVYDRQGRFVGTARGGVEASPEAPQSTAERWAESHQGESWHQGQGGFPDDGRFQRGGTERRYVVKGPDGRLWVVAENRTSW